MKVKKILPIVLAAVSAILFLMGIFEQADAMTVIVASLVISVCAYILFKTVFKTDSILAGVGRIGCASMIAIDAVYIVTFILIPAVLTDYIGSISI